MASIRLRIAVPSNGAPMSSSEVFELRGYSVRMATAVADDEVDDGGLASECGSWEYCGWDWDWDWGRGR